MILRKLALQRIALKAGLYVAFSLSFWLAFWLRFHSSFVPLQQRFETTDYVILYLVAIVAWGALSRVLQLDQLWVASNPDRWMKSGAWATLGTLTVLFFGAFFFRTYSFSRLFIILLGAVNLALLVVTLGVLRILVRRRDGKEITVLIVGDSTCASEVSGVIASNPWVRCDVVGYLTDDEVDHAKGVARLGRLEDLELVCRQHQPDEILVAVPLAQLWRVADFKRALARVPVPSRLVCDFLKEVASGWNMLDFFGMPVVELHRTGAARSFTDPWKDPSTPRRAFHS
jgi:FlaA1/EpsC-like NDP-sugar epimerase